MTHACIKLADPPLEPRDTGSGLRQMIDQRKNIVACEEKKQHHDGQPGGGSANKEEKNLDSGYAWLILAVMFLLASSTGGTNRVYGLIYAKQVAIGYYDHEEASWPIATASTVENLAGLMTPALAQYLTWRQIELCATFLFVVANVGAYFSDSLLVDILCLGIIQGLALSINTVLSLVINNDYFKRYRTTAYGISLSGSTFGIIYLGPIVSWCLEQDDKEFRSGYLAIGGVLALNALLVIFIKPRTSAQDDHGPDEKSAGHDLESSAPKSGRRKRSLLERHLERKNSVASIALMCKQKRQTELQQSTLGRSSMANTRVRSDQVFSTSATTTTTTTTTTTSAVTVDWGKPLPVSPKLARELCDGEPRRGTLRTYISSSDLRSTALETSNTKPDAIDRLGLSSGPLQCKPHRPIDGYYHTNIMISSANTDGAANGEKGKLDKIGGALFHRSPSLIGSSNRSSVSSFGVAELDRQPDNLVVNIDGANDTGIKELANKRDVGEQDKLSNASFQDDIELTKAAINSGKENMGKGRTGSGSERDEGLSVELVGALLRSPYLHCVWIMLSLYYLIARIYIIILVDLAKDNGLSSGESRALLNYWSIGEIVGRIVLCSFVDLQWLSVRLCILLTCTSMSISISAMALLGGSFHLYAICSALVAALISLEYVLINVLMIEYLGQSRVTSCYSLGSFISSLALLGRPALIGLFRDHLGSYNGLLLLLAGLSLSFGLLFGLMEPLLVRYWPKGRLHHRSQPLSDQ